MAGNANHNAPVLLDTFLVSFFVIVSPLLNEGCSFFVENASSAILIKSIFVVFKIVVNARN